MNASMRQSLPVGLIVGLLAVIVIGLLPSGEPPTAEERVEAIASNIKCPACAGASIADANSSVARDLLVVIREQVDAGLSDDDIYDYFVARFSDAALLSPPTRGWGLWLWLLPVAVAGLGGFVIVRRRTGSDAAAGRAADRLDAAEQDLVELESQLVAGELDEVTAAALRRGYEAEAATARSVLAEPAEPGTGPQRRRVLAGSAFVIVALLAIGLSVGAAVRDRQPGGVITGDVVEAAAQEGAVDLASVTNEEMEEVVARFPDNVPMRRALANRYFFDGQFDKAFDHYFAVLEIEPDPVALANIGWIMYVSSTEFDAALRLVERSLEIEPDNPMAYWYEANIRLGAFEDAAGAIDPLLTFLQYPDLPDELRTEAERLLETAEAAL